MQVHSTSSAVYLGLRSGICTLEMVLSVSQLLTHVVCWLLCAALHKLCVQQCPRSSVVGLVWLLEQAGFSSVQLSTSLETYYVGRNVFTGFTSIITCGL
jgi:hypothetical protein